MEELEHKKEIIERLFPESLPMPEELEQKYPPRELPEGAMVTRIAPSPTGFMHIGSLYTALISERFAHQTNGVFYLRIDDTDKKREVKGATDLISQSLDYFGIQVDEGRNALGTETGPYAPYTQSERLDIYKTFVKSLLVKGMAYPCFCTPEDLEEIRQQQQAQGVRPGYYRQWAKWRNKSFTEIMEALSESRSYVIRFKSNGEFNRKIIIEDEILGKRKLSENDQDVVIMKSDGLPTYHMAHVVDDHLMRTTHVIRGDEWLSSLPLHIQLFEAMGWQPPRYVHIAPIQKIEGSSKRKLSKRKDPEANVAYFEEQGYPKEAIVEYLINLANSNFEDWRKSNPEKNYQEFTITFEKLKNSSGALFDFNKLNDISKEVVARFTANNVYARVLAWAGNYNTHLSKLLKQYPEYSKSIFAIERGSATKARKDIIKWSDVWEEIQYFFNEDFHLIKQEAFKMLSDFTPENISKIVREFISTYNHNNSKDQWFEKVKKIARDNNYAESAKEFKKNPDAYKGNVADVAKIFRVLLTSKIQTPDLYSIIQTMGQERVFKRLSLILE